MTKQLIEQIGRFVNATGLSWQDYSLWSWGEIRRFPTTAEEMTAYREWKASQ